MLLHYMMRRVRRELLLRAARRSLSRVILLRHWGLGLVSAGAAVRSHAVAAQLRRFLVPLLVLCEEQGRPRT